MFLIVLSCNNSGEDVTPVPEPGNEVIAYPSYRNWDINANLDTLLLHSRMYFIEDSLDYKTDIIATDHYRKIYYWQYEVLKKSTTVESFYETVYKSGVNRFYPILEDGYAKVQGEYAEQEFRDSVLTYMSVLNKAAELTLVKSTQDSLYYKLEIQRVKSDRMIKIFFYETVGKKAEKRSICVQYEI